MINSCTNTNSYFCEKCFKLFEIKLSVNYANKITIPSAGFLVKGLESMHGCHNLSLLLCLRFWFTLQNTMLWCCLNMTYLISLWHHCVFQEIYSAWCLIFTAWSLLVNENIHTLWRHTVQYPMLIDCINTLQAGITPLFPNKQWCHSLNCIYFSPLFFWGNKRGLGFKVG